MFVKDIVKIGEYALARDYSGQKSGITAHWLTFLSSKFNDDKKDIFRNVYILNLIDVDLSRKLGEYENQIYFDVMGSRELNGFQPTILNVKHDLIKNPNYPDTIIGTFYIKEKYKKEFAYYYLRQKHD